MVALSNLARAVRIYFARRRSISVQPSHPLPPSSTVFFRFSKTRGTSTKRAKLSFPAVFHKNKAGDEREKKTTYRERVEQASFSLSLSSPLSDKDNISVSCHSYLTHVRHPVRIFEGNEACVRSGGLIVRLSISNQLEVRARLTYARNEGLKKGIV